VVAVSGQEVQLATSCGVGADRILLNGNGKQPWELRLAVRLRCLVNVDSVFDVRRLLEICRTTVGDDSDDPVRVLLRLNPDIDTVSIPLIIDFATHGAVWETCSLPRLGFRPKRGFHFQKNQPKETVGLRRQTVDWQAYASCGERFCGLVPVSK